MNPSPNINNNNNFTTPLNSKIENSKEKKLKSEDEQMRTKYVDLTSEERILFDCVDIFVGVFNFKHKFNLEVALNDKKLKLLR